MEIKIENIKITAIAATLPKEKFNIDEYSAEFGEKKIKRIKKSTGVEEVHVVTNGTTASDLCFDATSTLINELQIDVKSIDAILFVSMSPDYKAPATAFVLQHRLGIKTDAVAMDLNYGCSAYVYGLYQAAMLIKAGGCKKVLLCAGDTQSVMVNPKDRAMRMLVGDAGTATIIEVGDGSFHFSIKSFGSGYENLIIPAGGYRLPCSDKTKETHVDDDGNIRSLDNLFMDGMGVMKFALTEVPLAMESIYKLSGLKKDDINLFAMHQPNKLILDYLVNSMQISEEKMPIGLQKTGNTGSASIPLLLTVLKERDFNFSSAKNVIACGFGIGLSIAAVTIDLSKTIITNTKFR